MRTLLATHDWNLSGAMLQALVFEGFWVEAVTEAELARARCRSELFDLVIVDLAMPDMDVTSFCRGRRPGPGRSPALVLVLAASGDETRAMGALEQGADAYLMKPFGSRAFLASVRAMVRRLPESSPCAPAVDAPAADGSQVVAIRDLVLDVPRRRVLRRGHALRLTEQQFRLLYLLSTSPNRVFTRHSLLRTMWPRGPVVSLRTVDALVKRVRHRLAAAGGGPAYVVSVRGVGYKFVVDPPVEGSAAQGVL